MKDGYGIFNPDWEFRLVEPEAEMTTLGEEVYDSDGWPELPSDKMATLGEEKLRLEVEIKELEADITIKLAGLPRWLRWLIRKGWPSIFRDL